MTEALRSAAIAVAVINAIAGAVGLWRWHRGGGSRLFWALLRAAQASAVAFALAVGIVAAAGRYSSEQLFYLYALLPLAIGFVAEQLRIAAAQAVLDQRGLEDAQAVGRLPEREQRLVVLLIVRREIGVMALAALVVAFLALRAAGTAHGF